MDFGGSCANDCLEFGLLGALQGVLLVGSHDLTVDAGVYVLDFFVLMLLVCGG